MTPFASAGLDRIANFPGSGASTRAQGENGRGCRCVPIVVLGNHFVVTDNVSLDCLDRPIQSLART
jgi:hypothetical protein